MNSPVRAIEPQAKMQQKEKTGVKCTGGAQSLADIVGLTLHTVNSVRDGAAILC